jgi:hypothetical protein
MSHLLVSIESEAASDNIALVTLPRETSSPRLSLNLPNEARGRPDNAPSFAPKASNLFKGRIIITIAALAGVSFLSSFSTGLLTIGLPGMGADIDLTEDLLVW